MNSSALDRYNDFRKLVANTFSVHSTEMVDSALCFAAEALEGFGARRYDNNPMLDHGVAVARIVAEEIGLGRNSTIAAIVHDVVRIATQHHSERLEEYSATIRRDYGEEVLGIALALCKISDIKLKASKEQASDFRDMIVSYSEDPRVILIKLADRLEVMPAYWWMYNMYALARNSWKYTARDKRKHKLQNIEFNAYAPDTMEEAAYAMTLLEKWIAKAWIRKNGNDPANMTQQELKEKGQQLLFGDKKEVKDLEVLAEEIEKGNRKVRVLKTYEAYHAYKDMITYYAVTNIMKYIQANDNVDTCESLHNHLAAKHSRCKNWINLGGQLVKEPDFEKLVSDIKTRTLLSWTDVHDRYNLLWENYGKDKAEHAYMLLCDVCGLAKITQDQWHTLLDKAMDIQDYICNQVYISRKKDYDNPFRKCTYRNDDEMIAAIGTIDENKFIVQIKDETKLFKQQVEELLSKLR